MEFNKEVSDLKISGSGTAGGGKYQEVSISGSGKINGDVQCESFKISGSGKICGSLLADEFRISGYGTVEGNLKCKDGKISGSGKVCENVEAEEFKISGSGTVEGDFKGKDFTISGTGTIGGKVSCDEIKVSGIMNAHKSVEGENIDVSGAIKCVGMVNAEKITINLNGSSSIGEIGAREINVKESLGSGFLGWIAKAFGNNYGRLDVKVIEADDIYLENTDADVVRGARIIIGKGCKIGRVEYSESLKILNAEDVKEKVQL